MYGKIFGSIYDGTLAEDWRALITFQQFIVLCDADGIIDMTPQSISRRTGIPIEHIKAGIEVLERVDKYSRTPDQEGRRIELIDSHRPWGWFIVNHEKYKLLKDSDTIRAQNRARKQKQRGSNPSRSVTLGHAESRYTDTDTDTRSKDIGQKNNFDLFWSAYPRKVKKKDSLVIWKRKKLDSKFQDLITDVKNRIQKDDAWKNGFIPHPTTYLRGERWNDDIAQPVTIKKTPRDMDQLAKELGLSARPGETTEQFHARARMTRND